MARPSCSTSGGQWAGRDCSASPTAAVVVAATAVAFEVVEEDVLAFCVFFFPEGSQYRNAVQILHGFPSGPNTIPGGRGFEFFTSLLPLPLAFVLFGVVEPSLEDELMVNM